MTTERHGLVAIQGPKGTAEVVEVFVDGSNSPMYEVRFGDEVHVHKAEGAASIEAMELVGL
ncbi:MAG: hypothetical protein IIC89_03180 [Chloroflexi bacterium]|nr:hypothetical protein [Chloroflexota bacterium]